MNIGITLFCTMLAIVSTCTSPTTSQTITSDKEIITNDHNIPASINEIEIGGGLYLVLDENIPEGTIRISTSKDIQEYVMVQVDRLDKTVKVRLKPNRSYKNANVTVLASSSQFEDILLTGGSKGTASTVISRRKLEIECSGGSKFEAPVDCDKISIEISGGSRVNLKGKCDKYEVSGSGGSTAQSYDLVCRELEFELSGGSRVHATVEGTIHGEASGGSSVVYTGNATIGKTQCSGGSSCRKK